MLESASCTKHMASAKSVSVNTCLYDAECNHDEMTIIPQAYWDELFDNALHAINEIPLDLAVMKLSPADFLKLLAYN
jgi:hypothetical protein